MTLTTLTSREFNQDVGRAKRNAEKGPIVITDRGQPKHVLMTFAEYQKLTRSEMSLAQALAMRDGDDIEWEAPEFRDEFPRDVDFD